MIDSGQIRLRPASFHTLLKREMKPAAARHITFKAHLARRACRKCCTVAGVQPVGALQSKSSG